jgi:hypothetical protein
MQKGMKPTQDFPQAGERIGDWLVPLSLAVGFLLWGLLIFFMVGVKWPPDWNFGVIPDVPGGSVYSSGGRTPLPTVASPYLHEQAKLSPQHVMSRPQPADGKTQEQLP